MVKLATKKFNGKNYEHYRTANSAAGRDAVKKMAERRYKYVRVYKPTGYGMVKYIIYVRGKKRT
jgi:hypothetical protein